jgi:hypothetical protein
MVAYYIILVYRYMPFPYHTPYNNNPMQSPHHMMPGLPEPILEPPTIYPQLKQATLTQIEPVVQHGLKEAQYTSLVHAMREAAAVAYLLGRGIEPRVAQKTVESREVNEKFYP